MGNLVMEKVLQQSKLTEKEFMLEIAVWLYNKERFTLGQGSKFAGISQYQFQQELGKRKIPVHYGIEELHEDLTNLGIPIS